MTFLGILDFPPSSRKKYKVKIDFCDKRKLAKIQQNFRHTQWKVKWKLIVCKKNYSLVCSFFPRKSDKFNKKKSDFFLLWHLWRVKAFLARVKKKDVKQILFTKKIILDFFHVKKWTLTCHYWEFISQEGNKERWGPLLHHQTIQNSHDFWHAKTIGFELLLEMKFCFFIRKIPSCLTLAISS